MDSSPYALLGLTPKASAEEIHRAWRKLAVRYPPELAPEQFARIHRAYQLLTSLERRMEAARKAPEEALDQLFPASAAVLKAPPPPPPPLTTQDLEPLRAPWRRARLIRLLRESATGASGPEP